MGGPGLWIRGKSSSNGKSATTPMNLHALYCICEHRCPCICLVNLVRGDVVGVVALLHMNSVSSGVADLRTPAGWTQLHTTISVPGRPERNH